MLVAEDDWDYFRRVEPGVVHDGFEDSGIRGYWVLRFYSAPVDGKHRSVENKISVVNRFEQAELHLNAERECVGVCPKHHRQHINNKHGGNDLIEQQADNDAAEELDESDF